ncbi:flxA-like family protein, partial [Escherichia coli]|nr:flxA-like family protein [Escherichia coli]EJO9365210.1 flxA-like family protein [Escherichia coli]EJR7499861.1 flxA-like family protein [Escherichia coli]EJT2513650.1 flxA-like family protein [Escherichia coli]EJZ1204237.1 flxA-like family protein [Escherichia coli]
KEQRLSLNVSLLNPVENTTHIGIYI